MPRFDPNSSFEELPDPLGPPGRDPLNGSEEDLLSQMAGDEVDRLLSADDLVPLLGHGAVQEMKSQIGEFFDQLHQRQRPAGPVPLAAELLEPHEVPPREDTQTIEDQSNALRAADVFGPEDDELTESSSALLGSAVEQAPEPFYLAPLNWLSDPIASLSAGGRALISTMAIMSFLSACAALAYVLILTRPI